MGVSTNLDIRITSVTLRVDGCKVFALLHVNLQCTLLEILLRDGNFCLKKLVESRGVCLMKATGLAKMFFFQKKIKYFFEFLSNVSAVLDLSLKK